MLVYVIFQVMPILLAKITAQYVQQLQQQPYPFFPPQSQPMMQMHMPNNVMHIPNNAMRMQDAVQASMPQIMANLPHIPGLQSLIHPPINMPPMQLPLNGGRLPMVAMPHYTKKKDKKKSKSKSKSSKLKKRSHHRHKARAADESCDSDSGYEYKRKKKRSLRRNRHEVLTPVISYLTKDGYVVYQKKIKKDKARDWLELSKATSDEYDKKVKKRRENR